MKNISIRELLDKNPQINEEELKKALELTQKIREAGVRRRGYGVISPYVRRIPRRHISDPRIVYVSNPPKEDFKIT